MTHPEHDGATHTPLGQTNVHTDLAAENTELKAANVRLKSLLAARLSHAGQLQSALVSKTREVVELNKKISKFQKSPIYKIAHTPRSITRALRRTLGLIGFQADGQPRHGFAGFIQTNTPEALAIEIQKPAQPLPKTLKNSILIAADYLPLYDRQSGGLRLKTIIDMIGELGRPMIFVSMAPIETLPGILATESGRKHYENELRNAGVILFLYGENALKEFVQNEDIDLRHAFLSFPNVAKTFIPLLRAAYPNAKLLYDMVDFHALRMEREANLTSNEDLACEAIVMEYEEIAIANASDVTIAVSDVEKQAMLDRCPSSIVETIPNLFHVPQAKPPGVKGRNNILFVGGFWHKPNSDAVIWFVNAIWPLIQIKAPDCQFIIAGSNPGPEIQELGKYHGIEVLDYIEDLTPTYDAARVAIAPLRFGAGVKGKVGQAMALGVPVVTTSIGAEGMTSSTKPHFLVADKPQAFADAVLALLTDNLLWAKTQRNARQFIETQFSIPAQKEKIRNLFSV